MTAEERAKQALRELTGSTGTTWESRFVVFVTQAIDAAVEEAKKEECELIVQLYKNWHNERGRFVAMLEAGEHRKPRKGKATYRYAHWIDHTISSTAFKSEWQVWQDGHLKKVCVSQKDAQAECDRLNGGL